MDNDNPETDGAILHGGGELMLTNETGRSDKYEKKKNQLTLSVAVLLETSCLCAAHYRHYYVIVPVLYHKSLTALCQRRHNGRK